MTNQDEQDNRRPARLTRFGRAADRLARLGWRTLLVVVALAVIGGFVVAAFDRGGATTSPSTSGECPSPPCFSIGNPRPSDLVAIIPALGYAIVIVLGIPSAFLGVRDVVVGRRRRGADRLLVFFGPVLVFVGMELLPHVVNPCLVAGGEGLAGFCQQTAHDASSVDVAGRWHALHHALIGAVPMTALYGWSLRRWRRDMA